MANQPRQLTLPAPAKLNLFLHIVGRRPDGYHNLQTVFQFLDYSDTLTVEWLTTDDIRLLTPLPGVDDSDNLIVKAAQLLKKTTACPLGASIAIKKKIPMGAGLGGGSSDAATTLLALNQLWQLNLSKATLLDLGKQLGADVGIFIEGESAFAEGIGNEFTPIQIPSPYYAIVIPNVHVSTIAMYKHPDLPRNTPRITPKDYLQGIPCHNDFTALVCKEYPPVAKALAWLSQFGQAQMTGSGCALFLPCENERQALDIVGQIPPTMIGFAAQGLNHSPLNWGVAKR